MFSSMSRKLVAAATVAAAAIIAQPGQATINITATAFDVGSKTGTINFTPARLSENALIGRFKLSGYDTTTNQAVTLLTYCGDLFQELGTGSFTQKTLFDMGFSTTKSNQLNALIANTASLATTATTSAAVQLAVWEIIYEYNTNSAYSLSAGYFNASGSDISAAKSLADTYVSNVTSGVWGTDASYTLGWLSSSSKQDQLYWTQTTVTPPSGVQVGQVPEPASWAMFIGGFGVIGGTMRRRRTKVAFAA